MQRHPYLHCVFLPTLYSPEAWGQAAFSHRVRAELGWSRVREERNHTSQWGNTESCITFFFSFGPFGLLSPAEFPGWPQKRKSEQYSNLWETCHPSTACDVLLLCTAATISKYDPCFYIIQLLLALTLHLGVTLLCFMTKQPSLWLPAMMLQTRDWHYGYYAK